MTKSSAPVTALAAQPTAKPARRRGTKPSKKTPERLAKLKGLLESGMSLRGATQACGMCESLIYKWRSSDPAVEELIQSALAESEHALVQLAMEGARKDGRVALMMLERRFPESWSKRQEHVHTHTDGGPLLAQLVANRRERDARLTAVTVEVCGDGEAESHP